MFHREVEMGYVEKKKVHAYAYKTDEVEQAVSEFLEKLEK
jgi:hypothetical protein